MLLGQFSQIFWNPAHLFGNSILFTVKIIKNEKTERLMIKNLKNVSLMFVT